MATEQAWCLECGTAVPGTLSQRGGWRMAAAVTGLTVLIASGIVAASYAALSSDSNRAVSRPIAVAHVVTVAPPVAPPVQPAPVKPATPPVTPVPKAAVPVTPAIPTAPAATSTPTTKPPATGAGSNTAAAKHAAKPTGPQKILLDTDAASIYDPANHPASTFGDPTNAIDDDPATAWTAQLDAAGKLGAGLNIDLKSPHKVTSLQILTDTPGMAVEVYATNGPLPATITDSAWVHLARKDSVKHRQLLELNTQGKRFRQIEVWIKHGPGGSGGGQVDVAELAVYP